MQSRSDAHILEFTPSRQRTEIDPAQIRDAVVEFLEAFAEAPLVSAEFVAVIGDGDGEQKLRRLLETAGFADDEDGFFGELLQRFASASWEHPPDPVIGGVRLPASLLLEVLEQVLPGDELFNVKRVARLEKLTNRKLAADEKADMQEVLDLYPVRLSSHVIRQMRMSPAVAYQYLPFVEELDPDGLVHTWVGQFHRGVIEQMYRNRVIFVLNMSCPVYCRFCFRKHKECRTQRPPTQRHVSLGIQYIRQSPAIKEIVITGGDPFMNRPTLTWAVDGMKNIRHVETLRLATRSLAYHPALFTARDGWWVDWLEQKQLELAHKGKRLEVATHFIHPDEVSRHSLEVISELTSRGVPVYVQTPFLGGCNDRGPELAELYRLLRGAGAEMHYIFMPCSPLQGNRRYRSTLADGFRAFAHLRANLSDRAVPHLCTATSIGKIDWGGSGWAVEPDEDDPRYLWLRTPYTSDYFETFAPILDLSQIARDNDEGTLDARFWVDVGDESWLLGPRETHGWSRLADEPDEPSIDRGRSALEHVQKLAGRNQGPSGPSIVPTTSPALSRVHLTRVELDLSAEPDELESGLGEVIADRRITDVVVFADRDVTRCLHSFSRVRERLTDDAPHVTALRLRSRRLAVEPRAFTEGITSRIGAFNGIRVTRPLRLEVELPLLHSSELNDDVGRVVRRLRHRGVTTYAVVPLLAWVNDLPEEMLAMTGGCRRLGIEVHHLVLAGHPLQSEWALEHPVAVASVVDLATALRRAGSGRELPRLVVQTAIGECDFGLTGIPLPYGADGEVAFGMLAAGADEWPRLDPKFRLPAGIDIDENDLPVVPVPGMTA